MADHGEVFTPPELVEAMIGLVESEAERIDSRFLEPACGSGNFLVAVLRRKLRTVDARYGKSEFERHHQALLALMSIYGVELLDDNVAECRANLLGLLAAHLGLAEADAMYAAALTVVELNIVHGDALSMQTRDVVPIPVTFAEWAYLGKGRYQRRDFRFETLTHMSSFRDEHSLFAELGKHEVFTPTKDYGVVTVAQLAESGRV